MYMCVHIYEEEDREDIQWKGGKKGGRDGGTGEGREEGKRPRLIELREG